MKKLHSFGWFPPLFATGQGRESIAQARRVLRSGSPEHQLDKASRITRRNLLEIFCYTTGAVTLTGIGSNILQEDNDIRKLDPRQRTKRFMEIGDTIQEQGCGQVEWRHPKSGPKNPILVRSYTHGRHDGVLPLLNHIPILVQESRSAIIAFEEGLRHFAVEGVSADQHIPPIVFAMVEKSFGGNTHGIPLYPQGSVAVTDADIREVLADNPDMTIATPGECRSIFSQEENMVSVFQAQSRFRVGARLGNLVAAILGEDARVTGLENPETMGELQTFYDKHVAREELLLKITALISQVLSDNNGTVGMNMHFDDQAVLTAVEVGGETFDTEEFVAVLREMLASAKSRAPAEPFHKARELYIADSLDAHMAFFGTDHLFNFANMQNPSRSIGIIWPTLPHFDEDMSKTWGNIAEASLAGIEEAKSRVVAN